MRKLTKKVKALALGMVLTVVVSGFGASPSQAIESPEDFPVEIKEALSRQAPVLDTYETLEKNLMANKKRSSLLESLYVEEYGGEYVDGDKLVVQLVNRTPAMESRYRALGGNSPNIMFEDVLYSLEDLEELEVLATELAKEYKIASYGVDQSENRFIIYVYPEDYQSLSQDVRLLEYTGKFLIEESPGAEMCAQTIYGGDRINRGSQSGAIYTMCIAGTYGGYPAILTAGHFVSNNQKFYRSNMEVGTVVFARANVIEGDMTINSLGDFSIVRLNTSNFTRNNRVRNATSTVPITGVTSSYPEGTTVYKYGSATGYSWGQITAKNQTVYYRDENGISIKYYIRGLIRSLMQNSTSTTAIDQGDSGGSVYTMRSGSVYEILGNVSGKNPSSNTMFTSPIGYAIDAGFTPLTS